MYPTLSPTMKLTAAFHWGKLKSLETEPIRGKGTKKRPNAEGGAETNPLATQPQI